MARRKLSLIRSPNDEIVDRKQYEKKTDVAREGNPYAKPFRKRYKLIKAK